MLSLSPHCISNTFFYTPLYKKISREQKKWMSFPSKWMSFFIVYVFCVVVGRLCKKVIVWKWEWNVVCTHSASAHHSSWEFSLETLLLSLLSIFSFFLEHWSLFKLYTVHTTIKKKKCFITLSNPIPSWNSSSSISTCSCIAKSSIFIAILNHHHDHRLLLSFSFHIHSLSL